MRPDSQQAGRRRRGGRRHRNNEGGRSPSSEAPTPKAPVKTGFFQKIIAFFTGKKASRPASTRSTSVRPATENGSASASAGSQSRSFRKPELVEVTSAKVYVGNLSFDASESDLFELFAGVGSVQNAEIVSHRDTQKSKGFAFVLMASVDEAKRAVAELHDKEFMGRRLVVSGAKTNDVRDVR